VPFREISVASEAQLAELKKAVGSNSVPALLVGPTVLKGFEAGGVDYIYKHLERISDEFEDVANQIDGIVVDHA